MAAHPGSTPETPATVSLEDPQAVRYWSERLNCTPSALREAVEEVGTAVAAVEEYLGEGAE